MLLGICRMLEEVSLFDQEIKFTIGHAGTGKSTELAKIVTEDDVVVTPTHKAARVLREKGIQNVTTIHALLKLVPTLNENFDPSKGHRMQRLKQMAGVDIADIKVIYLDEYSMVSTKIFDLLLSMLPEGAVVHLFGDQWQLKPVDGEPIIPEDYSDDIHRLTTQYRADAPEIVETFERFVSFLDGSGELDLTLNKKIKKGTLKKFNPETDRALAFTNERVQELNSEIAKVLKLPEDFEDGTPLSLNQIDCEWFDGASMSTKLYPTCITKGKLMEDDKLQIASQKTSHDIEKYRQGSMLREFEEGKITIDNSIYSIHYDLNHYKTQQELKANIEELQRFIFSTHNIPSDTSLKQWCAENPHAEGVKERGKAWSRFLAHTNYVFSLQRPYATTVHKSQGSEFSTVYIAQEDLKKSIFRGFYGNYARLMYVSLSRAINKVVIV